MKKLDFQESDLREMKKFYLEELEKTIDRLNHIKSILEKLEGNSNRISISIVQTRDQAAESTSKGGRVKSKETTSVKAPKTPGGKKRAKKQGVRSAWARLILKQLAESNKPLTYNELTEEVMKSANIPPDKQESTKRSIVNVAFRLKNRDKKIRTFSTGQKEKYIARTEWFDDSGRIDKDYLQKINA